MRVSVTAKTGVKHPGVTVLSPSHFAVSVSEVAHEGKANRAIIKSLARHLNISPSVVVLIKGITAREKIFDIPEIKR